MVHPVASKPVGRIGLLGRASNGEAASRMLISARTSSNDRPYTLTQTSRTGVTSIRLRHGGGPYILPNATDAERLPVLHGDSVGLLCLLAFDRLPLEEAIDR